MKKRLTLPLMAIMIITSLASCIKDDTPIIYNPINYISIPYAEYRVQQSNSVAVQVRYYIENKSTSSTLCYLKFSAKHPSGVTDIREIGSKTNTSEWTLEPGTGTYTPFYNCNIHYQDGTIDGEILDYMFN